MAIRADQLVMGGVVLLGVGAVVLLLTTKPRAPEPESTPLLTGDPNAAQPSEERERAREARYGARSIIGRSSTPGRAILNPGSAQRPVLYRGRLEVDPGIPIADLARALEQAGFKDVTVYRDVAAAERAGMTLGLLNPTAGSRWFQASWRHTSGHYNVPAAIVLLYPTATPTPSALASSSSGFQSLIGGYG